MSSEKPLRPVPRHPSVWWSRLRWRWPFLVWLGVAALAWVLYEQGGEYIRVNGMVEIVTESVSPLEEGRIVEIPVIPGQAVEAGDVVAELDSSFVEEEIAVLMQDLSQQRAEHERQFTTAEQRLRGDLRDYEMDQIEDAARLEVYEAELARLEPLVESGLATAGEVADLRARAEGLRRRAKLYPGFIKSIQEELVDLQAAHERAMAMNDPAVAAERNPELQLLLRRKDNMKLRVQQSGIVARVRREPGEVVTAGEKVVDIVTERPRRILAFMNETDTRPVDVGDVVEVEPSIGGERFPAQIVSISPNIIALPDRASPIPERVVRGRRLELVPQEPVDLTPGASMVVILPKARLFWISIFGGDGNK